jgi:hypothetical protein
VIQLVAIIDGKRSVMLTPHSIEEAKQSCRGRFGADRFEGFAPIPVETVAKAKWAEYRAKQITRAELEAWLAEQDDEQEIRVIFNKLRG